MANLIRIENQDIPKEMIESVDYEFRKVKCSKGWGVINVIFKNSSTPNIIDVPEISESEFDYYCKNINEQLQNV